MKKIITLILVMFFSTEILWGTVTRVNYVGKFGILGTIGSIKTTINRTQNSYSIDTKIDVKGVAKILLGSHNIRNISKGHIENGLMVSDLYQSIERYDDTVLNQEYWVNHKTKRVTKKVKKYVGGKVVKDETKRLDYYAKDDLLTFYFNLDSAVKKQKRYQFKVIGLEKQDGNVNLRLLSQKDSSNGIKWYAKAHFYQKNFKNKEGDVLLSMGQDEYIKKAVIEDVLLYGDATLQRVK